MNKKESGCQQIKQYYIGSCICSVRKVWRTLIHTSWPFSFMGAYASGHEYQEQEDGRLQCKTCGDISE